MSFKDFDAAEAERTGDPVRFRLGGQDWVAAHVNAANFLAFSRTIAEGGSGAITGFDDYITGTLEEDQRAVFHQMLRDSEVSLSTLMKLGQWIVEQASGNPTDAASLSRAQPSSSGAPPRVVSLSRASTPEDSHSAAG